MKFPMNRNAYTDEPAARRYKAPNVGEFVAAIRWLAPITARKDAE